MYPYTDATLPIGERVENLLSLMTVEEKIGQMFQVSFNVMSKEEFQKWKEKGLGSYLHVLGDEAEEIRALAQKTRLKIPPIFGIDAIHGHALLNGATIFPSQLAMSCSWNRDLIFEMGRATAKEVAADGLDWTFSPVLCIGRDHRWGRVDETFGEDSYLIGELGAAIISGYQHDKVIIACAKHYIGYGEANGGRDAYDTQISVRKVKETFLPPFKRAADVGCASFMTGYGSIDATPLTADKRVLRGLLKEEIGVDGFVVTDWNNIESLLLRQKVAKDMDEAVLSAIEAGNDMSMNSLEFYDTAIRLVNEGRLSMELVDDAVRRILTVKFKLGLFEGRKQVPKEVIACKEHIDINHKLTRESLVLLENRNNTLPLAADTKTIAVIGPNGDDIRAQYGDWTLFSHPEPKDVELKNDYYTVLRGMKTVFADSEILYHKGCDIMDAADQQIDQAVEVAGKADAIVAVVGDCLAQNGEGKDRADLELSGAQLDLLKALKATGKPLIAVLVNGKPLCIRWLKENCDALVEMFNGGDLGGLAAAELIGGKFNPSGKLTISFPQHSAQIPNYYNQYSGWHGGKYMDVPEEPLYPFGFGRSFTSYEYSNLTLSQTEAAEGDELTVSVDVTNTGSVDGREIVQLYINDLAGSILTPVKQLKGFAKVDVPAGQTVTVTIPLAIADLAIVNQQEQTVVEPGEFDIMVGASSESYLTARLTVN